MLPLNGVLVASRAELGYIYPKGQNEAILPSGSSSLETSSDKWESRYTGLGISDKVS